MTNNIPIDSHVLHKWLCKDKPCDRQKEIFFLQKAIANLDEVLKVNKKAISESQYNHVKGIIIAALEYSEHFYETKHYVDPNDLRELFQISYRCYWDVDIANSGRKALLWTELGDLMYALYKLDHWALCDLVKYYDEHIVISGQAKENDATPMA